MFHIISRIMIRPPLFKSKNWIFNWAIFLLIPTISYNQTSSPASTDKHVIFLNDVFQDLNSGVYNLLQLSKQAIGQNQKNKTTFKLRNLDCAIFNDIDPMLPSFYRPESVDITYNKIQERDDYTQLQINDQKIWVLTSCVEEIANANPVDQIFYKWQSGEAGKFNLLDKLEKTQESVYNHYLKYLKKYENELKNKEYNSYRSAYSPIINKIERKKIISDQIIIKQRKKLNKAQEATQQLVFLDRLQLSAQILLGSSSFNSQTIGNRLTENTGGNTDLNIQGKYLLDAHSAINFKIENRNQTLITPYNRFTIGAGYSTRYKGNNVNVQTQTTAFSDKVNTLNDNSRILFNGSLANYSKKNLDYRFNYQFLNQSNSTLNNGSYSKHALNVHSTLNKNNPRSFQLGLVYNAGASDNPLFNYSFINPRVAFHNQNGLKRNSVFLSLESTGFDLNNRLSNERYQIKYASSDRNSNGLNIIREIGLIYRTYPQFESTDYVDLVYKNRRQSFEEGMRATMIRLRYMPNLLGSSHADIRYTRQRGNKSFIRFDSNIRLLYPEEESMLGRLDGYLKLGFDLRGIKLGPIFRWHVTYDLKNADLGTFDYNQNNYQYGLEARGNISALKNAFKMFFRVSYDMNLVYNRVLFGGGPDPISEVTTRTPRNFQLDIDLAYHVNRFSEVFLRIDQFDHNTGYSSTDPSSFLMVNRGTKMNLGVRMRNF